jgi:hypothetical protein
MYREKIQLETETFLGHIPHWSVQYCGELQRLYPTVMLPGVPGSEQHQKDTNAFCAK